MSARGVGLLGLSGLLLGVVGVAAGCSRTPAVRLEWTAMGTVAAVQARGPSAERLAPRLRDEARVVVSRLEALLNAHDPRSALSRLAALPDAEALARCPPAASNCLAAAFRLKRESCGAFDPRHRGARTLDLGAIAKGLALDEAGAAVKAPAADALLDLGGSLKVVSGAWRVGIAGTDTVLVLTNGMACATSSACYRGPHIRDGRTRMAVTNDVVSVTVVHPTSAMLADGLSTTLFVLGRDAGERFRAAHYPESSAHWVLKGE